MEDTLAADRRRAIETELYRLEENAMYGSQMQFEQAKLWRGVNLVLGIPASVLAAVAGATALAATAGRIAAGILALTAAGFGALLTTLNASYRTNQAAVAATGYLAVQTAARQLRTIDLPAMDLDDARKDLAALTSQLDEQNKSAAPPSGRVYRRAKTNIEGGGQTYAVDADKSQGA
jgi:hypothetical protein